MTEPRKHTTERVEQISLYRHNVHLEVNATFNLVLGHVSIASRKYHD